LALHKSYAIVPRPNYPLCTDEADIIQLTDGRALGSTWNRKSTVGWRKMSRLPEITIDLGKNEFIKEVRIHSIGGGYADVEFADFVAVLVSNDNKLFRFAGFVNSIDLVKNSVKKIAHTFVIKNIKTEGRFVKVVMQTGGNYLFLDEIEIIKSLEKTTGKNDKWPQFTKTEVVSKVVRTIEAQSQLEKKIAATIEIVEKNMQILGSSFSDKAISNLNNIAKKLTTNSKTSLFFRRLESLNSDVSVIRAGIYRKIYNKPYVCLAANPMKMLTADTLLTVDSYPLQKIDVQLWTGEYESVAFNILNSSEMKMRFVVSVSPLVGPKGVVVDSKKTFTIRRAVFVNARRGGRLGDALVLQNEKPFELEPGEISQVWLGIFNPNLLTGKYDGTITISAKVGRNNELPIKAVPITIQIVPIRMSRNTKIATCTWAYPQIAGITRNHQEETAANLNAHYTNVFVVNHKSMPFPKKVLADGTVIMPSFAKLDKLLKMNDYAKTYLLWYGFNPNWKDAGRFGKWMSPQWKKSFSFWIRKLVEHLKERGVCYDRFVMYPFDESLCEAFYELAGLIKSIDPNIRIYANSFGKGPRDFERFRKLVDIWCLQDGLCEQYPEWLDTIKSFGGKVWTYGGGWPAKASNPYQVYRLMPWRAFKRGQTGAGFWVYADPIESQSWDDITTPKGNYGVIYGSAHSSVDTLGENIIPSRRWEAWREGVEDYEYLYEFGKMIDASRHQDRKKADQLQSFLDGQVRKVLSNPNNPELVYQARKNITGKLLELMHN
jgi:hypothetical protein